MPVPFGFPQTGWNWIGWIGVVPLLSSCVWYCPAYSLFGISTCGTRPYRRCLSGQSRRQTSRHVFGMSVAHYTFEGPFEFHYDASKLREGNLAMSYTLDQYSADCRSALLKDPGLAGRELVRQYTEKACTDPEFVAKYLGPDAEAERENPSTRIPTCTSAFLPTSTRGRRIIRRTTTARAGRSTARLPASRK